MDETRVSAAASIVKGDDDAGIVFLLCCFVGDVKGRRRVEACQHAGRWLSGTWRKGLEVWTCEGLSSRGDGTGGRGFVER